MNRDILGGRRVPARPSQTKAPATTSFLHKLPYMRALYHIDFPGLIAHAKKNCHPGSLWRRGASNNCLGFKDDPRDYSGPGDLAPVYPVSGDLGRGQRRLSLVRALPGRPDKQEM